MRNCFILFFLLVQGSLFIFGQASLSTPQQAPGSTDQIPTERNRSKRNSAANQNFFPFKAKRNKDQENRLKPSREDIERFSDFLKQPGTGIFRLVNDLECESNVYVIRVDENCRNSIPGGSFYSIREREYTTAYLADLRLKDGLMISDGILSQNILVRLGEIPLENLSVDTAGMRFLTDFVPEVKSGEATRQYIEIVKGIRTEDHEYRKVLPSIVNNTYAIRIIAYKGSVYRSFRGWLFDLLAGDKRVDLTVGFRIVRKDADGSITVLWKELDRKKSPKLKNDRKRKGPMRPSPYVSNKLLAEN